ncbi:DNA-directed RNA polymerase subunit beta [Marinitoga aeolica]|uniref:DNA-directed RNA polymerase subunit beta n=1 Tax=Marinitoga aeolica TaxID=2809031 RepID=A0ABY8PNF3_9BACT|nr:DNA-directed RNA polymerase subunit beta [Marinitoga aeolica]
MNTRVLKVGKRERHFFGKVKEDISLFHDLLEIQLDSFDWFVKEGVKEVLDKYSPITVELKGKRKAKISLEFTEVWTEDPIFEEMECKEKGLSYTVPLKAKIRITDHSTGEIIEPSDSLFFGNIPKITDRSTFIINGAERVVVNQLVRSPGVYFVSEEQKSVKQTRPYFVAHFLPVKGAWLEIIYNPNPGKDFLQIRIDRKRKFNYFLFLRALGYDSDLAILDLYPHKINLNYDLTEYLEKNITILSDISVPESSDLYKDTKTYRGVRLTEKIVEELLDLGVSEITVAHIVAQNTLDLFKKSYESEDSVLTPEEAYKELFKKLRPGEIPRVNIATDYINNLYFNPNTFDFSMIGRKKIVNRMEDVYKKYLIEVEGKIIEKGEDIEYPHKEERILTKLDLILASRHLLEMKENPELLDTRDHLGNKRVRSVGELMQIEFERSFSKMLPILSEKLSIIPNIQKLNPNSLINSRAIMTTINQFFATSQLSQFMDQVNPLSELTHKRRLSAIGPGGLKREHAKFEVRDVHHSHYGRMCPIETPEGANIGLITSLAILARVDEFGFLETPYYRVKNGKVLYEKGAYWLTADQEEEKIIAPASVEIDENGMIKAEYVEIRHAGKVTYVHREDVEFIAVTPKQIVSVSTSLIPFLEHDDANRALMGSNMQRQAVPLMITEAPFVGTGVEWLAARDSGYVIKAKHRGKVSYVDAKTIIINRIDESGKEILDNYGNPVQDKYTLWKFIRSNQDTTINQRPIVDMGEIVEKNAPIADGPAIDMGELALGKNVLVAFMPWEGYNFEDAILVNEELLERDTFTSLHIEVYETKAMDTQLGPEEITADIPNVKKESLRNLDEHGIVRVGAYVTSGDILVGKVTPRGESETSPEEKLIRSVFGDRGKDVKDTSLTVPHGIEGRVIDVKVYTRKDIPDLETGVNQYVKVYIASKKTLNVGDKLAGRHGNKGVVSNILRKEDMPFLPNGKPIEMILSPLGVPSRMNLGQVLEMHLGWLAKLTGKHFATPIFDGAKEKEIMKALYEARKNNRMDELDKVRKEYGLDLGDSPELESGKIVLRDGRTGEPFDYPIAIGYMYMLRLVHIAKDKMHARSTGPYSLIHQQPLGGKAHFGGQRFGEMEVWALEAYGAAHTLTEMLTYKSDDIKGRNEVYKAILNGKNLPDPGIPESFKVLVKELQGLMLDVRLFDEDGNELDVDKL